MLQEKFVEQEKGITQTIEAYNKNSGSKNNQIGGAVQRFILTPLQVSTLK